MSKLSTPKAPKVEAPKVDETPKAPETKPEVNGEAKKKKGKRVDYTEVFPTAEAAEKEANDRTKGPRRAFKVEMNGSTFYVVHNNEGRAAGVAALQLGCKVEELGKAAKKAKNVDFGSILSVLPGYTPEQLAALAKEIEALKAKA